MAGQALVTHLVVIAMILVIWYFKCEVDGYDNFSDDNWTSANVMPVRDP